MRLKSLGCSEHLDDSTGSEHSMFIGLKVEVWQTMKLSDMQELLKQHVRKFVKILRRTADTGQKNFANRLLSETLFKSDEYRFVWTTSFLKIDMSKKLEKEFDKETIRAVDEPDIDEYGHSRIWEWMHLAHLSHLEYTVAEFEEAVKKTILDTITSRMNAYELMTFNIDCKKDVEKMTVNVEGWQ
jgi:hypothetical protein